MSCQEIKIEKKLKEIYNINLNQIVTVKLYNSNHIYQPKKKTLEEED